MGLISVNVNTTEILTPLVPTIERALANITGRLGSVLPWFGHTITYIQLALGQ